MTRVTSDVCVIGAGPAGSVFATRLAQLGFDVCIIERTRFPRRHLGESLSPGVVPLLESAGARACVEAAGLRRVHSVSTNWDGGPATRLDPGAQGAVVDRGAFDAALLAHAVASGVRVLQPASVRDRARTPDGWRLTVDADGAASELHTRFVADASGRAGATPGRRSPTGPRTIAIHGYWRGARLPDQPSIEAGEHEWYWGVPIPGIGYNTLVFVDGQRLRAERGTPLDALFRELIGRSSLMQECRAAELIASPTTADATPYFDDDCIGEAHIKVGDAALALDPLSSSGVQKAIQTALAGAIVVNTLLRRPESAGAARQFHRDSVRDASERHRAWAATHYATAASHHAGDFWRVRSSGAPPDAAAPTAVALQEHEPIQLSPRLQWVDIPCLGGHFVEVKSSLRHPGLDAPIAYLGGWELAPLLRKVHAGMTPLQVAQAWSARMSLDTGLSIAGWLIQRGLIERYAAAPRPEIRA